jgi:transposase InsO family protein
MKNITPYQKELRLKWYALAEREKRTVKEVCRTFGIPKKMYYKWYRYDHGYGSNDYMPKKEHPATKLTRDLQSWIAERKRKTNYGPEKMAIEVKRVFALTVSSTIIYRLYLRKKLIRKPQKHNPWYEPLKEKLLITRAGEGVQIDVKYVWRDGKRHYQFSVFDPYTELYFFLVFPTKESKNAVAALVAAESYFGFGILSVQTDNGSEFRGEFHAYCDAKNLPHYFIPKKSPWWNGKVERVHRTMDEEYYLNPLRQWKTPEEWLEYYNTERIHLSINGKTPREKVTEALATVTP